MVLVQIFLLNVAIFKKAEWLLGVMERLIMGKVVLHVKKTTQRSL